MQNDKRTLDLDATRIALHGKFWMYAKEHINLQMPKLPQVYPVAHYVGNHIADIQVYTSFGNFIVYVMKYVERDNDEYYYTGYAPTTDS